ncbi:TniQ family protein (plasmid) [Mesorhizobium sp. AR07]|uniref:TniQ family protein n=1 Tax=Mesorhizobium sp. AR07 TaxID=2865838 RepID=UPI0021605CC5|nr:TniQ family protein [Mesorhizobium sp. AR07]UVK49153.1 TniQ family protein [Mesorhizobium sp. AR07]
MTDQLDLPVESFTEMKAFPLAVRQVATEPKHGLFGRTVERNLRGDFGRFCREIGVRPGRQVFNLPVEDVARLCVADLSVLEHASARVDAGWIHLLGQRFRKRDVRFGSRRWCPQCLRGSGTHRAWWDVGFVTTCPEHRCALLEACQCGVRLTWHNSPSFYFCACGRELAYARTEQVPEAECAFDAYVIGRMDGARASAPSFLDRVPMDEAVETCREIGKFALDPFQTEYPMAGKNGVRKVMNAGLAMVLGLPDSFQNLLDRIEAERPKQPPAPVYSDEFRYWLVHGQPDGVDGNVSWHLGDCMRERPAKEQEPSHMPYGHFTYAEAAEQCGIPERRLRLILRQMQARRREAVLPKPKSLDPHTVYRLASDIRSGKSVREVAQELGVSSADVGAMVRLHLLLTVADAEQGVPCIIRGKATEFLLGWLRSKAVTDGTGPELPLPAAAAAQGVSVADMVEMVRKGSARVTGVTDGTELSSILVDVVN